ncbi:hypothetical protein K4K59_008795 [Colletotrichum sp. SAR11_240]|nr:hypothetical protein K4K59_008795 [Colletotrichum sp. SAR11_240]
MVLTISVATVESKAAIPAYLIQIKKKFNFHEITHVPDLFWVKAESFDFSEEAHNELRVWREDPNQLHRLREEWQVHTLCHIRYSYRKLAFGFTDMNEALNMSRTGITILAHTGWMRPFDIRGIPIICVKCSKPRHMKDQCVKEIPRCGSRKDNGDKSRKMHEEAKRYDQLNPEWALRNFQNPPPEAAAKMMAESAVVAALTKLNLDNSSKEKWRATKGSKPRTAPPAAQDVTPAGAQNGGNAVDHDQFAPGQDEVAAGQDQATNVPGQHATTQSQEAVSEQGTATQNQRDVTESHLSPGAETVAPVDKPAINQQQLQCRSRPMPRLEKRHVDEPLPEGGDQDSAKQKGNTKKRKVRREQLDLDATFSERDEGE